MKDIVKHKCNDFYFSLISYAIEDQEVQYDV